MCGRASAAERDVLENARRRWPAVAFEVRNVAVQGVKAVPQVVQAVRELDADEDVDVIVVARGGGSVEDLLPFSDEQLVRAVADCRTPVVSAIGHEPDSPLLDLVADLRASTPTDAAKKVVPDVGEELERVRGLRDRALRTVQGLLDREERGLAHALARPVMEQPLRMVGAREDEVSALLARSRRVSATSSTGPTRSSRTRGRGSGRCRPPRRSNGGTRCSSGRTARWFAPRRGRRGRGAAGPGRGGRVRGAARGGRRLSGISRRQQKTTDEQTDRRTDMAAGTSTGKGTDGAALGYEQARDELIEVVRRLEAGGTTLRTPSPSGSGARSWRRCAGSA